MAPHHLKHGLVALLLVFLNASVALGVSDFQKKVSKQGNAQNDAFHKNLLKQLADARSSSLSQSLNAFPTQIGLFHPALPTSNLSDLSFQVAATTPYSFATNASNTFQVYTEDTLSTTPAPSDQCATALTATLACNSTIPLMAISPYIFTDDLSIVCTNDCTVALESYRAGVVSGCKGYSIAGSGNITYAPTLAVDYVAGPYMVQCLQDPSTLQYCGPLVESYNATGGLLSLPTNELCSYCTLETLNVTLSNPVTYSVAVASLLSSAVQTCGQQYASYNVTTPPGDQVVLAPGVPSFGVNATTSPTTDCAITGRNYTNRAETTCAAVATTLSVSEYSVLASNPFLTANCTIPADTTLCIPQACTTYTIATNDTCDSVAALAANVTGTAITTTQLLSFNPDLGTYCQLMPLRVGKQICLTPNGGFPNVGATSGGNPSATPTTFAPIPTPTVSGTTADCGRYYQVKSGDICQTVALSNGVSLADFLTLNPELNANCTNLWLNYYYCVAPYPPFSSALPTSTIMTNYSSATIMSYTIPTNYTITTYTIPLTTAGVPAPTNVANGTRTVACGNYYDIVDGDTLASVANLTGVNATQLMTWNPELSSGTLPPVGSAICIVFPRGNYTLFPVPRPTNAYANATNDCAEYYTVQGTDGCTSIEDEFALTSAQLVALNPGLKTDCTNLVLGLAYCVFSIYAPSNTSSGSGPPGNVAPGTITDGCTAYYTVVANDTCSAIETKFNLTNTEFLTYNPEISSSCSNIEAGLAYCVASNATTSGGGGSSGGAPSNLATGSFSNCTTYHTVVSGDNCPALETTYAIAAADLFRWNPEVNVGCTNIDAGEAYCVGGGGDQCAKLYTVQSGDSCFAITQSQNITQAELDTLNPFLGSDCSLVPGENLCLVAGTNGPPTNLASGSFSNCTAYHTVVSGDNCPALETTYNIAAADLFKWNPEVNTACTNIIAGEAYCVGGGGAQCAKLYTVQSGDSCFAITQSQDITQTELDTLNPFLDANCDLIPGENLCIG
ncbi:hypothetical protein M0805_001222 [Coniferiporia weirii]|nr:hypothetical protein M0805_001222 [Coniferiporia weirii]